ncbi:MAG: PD-(D/E)XK nuclease family protein [Alphaproteobacteria bacterium]|nr:PD-(D/E)XK nuclease family protein [Alphaproteobacteria bacterium]
MVSNKNIFCATNPARIADALWQVMVDSQVDVADMLIFLPSRRALRTVEKMIAAKSGGVAFLPTLVALGEGVDDDEEQSDAPDVISNTERVVLLAKLLAAVGSIGNLGTALPIAHDLVRVQDYLENEGIDAATIDWGALVDEKYAAHFQSKAEILNILSGFMAQYANGRITAAAAKNRDIRAWKDVLNKYKLVIVCASTASVPATADLMCEIAQLPYGRIILSGKIGGRVADFELNTHPYNSEHKFLTRLGLTADDVIPIDVGPSAIDFMNVAFSNAGQVGAINTDLMHCHLIECGREAIEAAVVAEIAVRSVAENKSVLVVTPDAAGNQRIRAAFNTRGLVADFSGAMSGAGTPAGRAILNLMDEWIEKRSTAFDDLYAACNNNLFDTVAEMVEQYADSFAPQCNIDDPDSKKIWTAIKETSDALGAADVVLKVADARAFVADAVSGVSVRAPMNDGADVVVLGTIESRMQTADVVILTGLNEGMFPARGYENAWLPRKTADEIGLPSPDRKVSLQALDFMNLSCGTQVYWVRSTVSGGVQTAESRFLSRVVARRGQFHKETEILDAVLARDSSVKPCSLDYSTPTPPADWSDVYVTELESLIHNPYAFYVRHILRLRVLDDYWIGPDARDFGNLVHDVAEKATDFRPEYLLAQMRTRASEKLGESSVLYRFWDKRFQEIAPVLSQELMENPDAHVEQKGCVQIAGRNVCAKADRFWDGGVLDFKTGTPPSKSQLEQGNMPQLPVEAFILQQGGFPIQTTEKSQSPIMKFLQMKKGNVRVVEYDVSATADMMRAAVDKTTELFNMYSAGGAGYEYHETSDQKYKVYDDFARATERK